MVVVKDEGSHFEAPVEVVWKYLQSPDDHTAAHKTSRNQQMEPINESSFLLKMEQNMGGHWVKVTNRVTIFPPIGMAIEMVEGPMAGSKMLNVYTPKGAKTEISVYGDFRSSQLPPNQIEPAVRGFLDAMFNEDAPAIKAMAQRK